MLPYTVCTLLTMLAVSSPPVESLVYKEVPATDALPKTSKVQTADEAQRLVMQTLGISEITDESISATLVRLLENRTPFIGDTIVGIPLWHVVITGWKGKVRTRGNTIEDDFARILDVYVKPRTGQILELRTRWPDDMTPIGAEPSSQEAAEQIRLNETYNSFASRPPTITFHEALKIIGNPFRAKQIIGHYVAWSRPARFMGGEFATPRPVWSIILRGVEMGRGRLPGVAKFNRRYMIDAVTGEYLFHTNVPKNKKIDAVGN